MSEPQWNEDHARLLAEARPAGASMSEADMDDAWTRLAGSIDESPRRPRRRLTLVAGGGAVAAVLAVGGVAAATTLGGAHTGEYNHGRHGIAQGGPGEFLDSNASDFPAVEVEETDGIPFPTEQARSISGTYWAKEMRDDGTEAVTTGALRGFVANDAICSWANTWAAGVSSGDDEAKQQATQELNDAATWPAVTALDTVQKMRHTTIDGVPADESTRFGYLSLVRAAAGGDSVDAMGRALYGNVFCIPALMTDLPQAVPTAGKPPAGVRVVTRHGRTIWIAPRGKRSSVVRAEK